MKITKNYLKQVIKEGLNKVLQEEEEFSNMKENELIKHIVEKVPSLKPTLSLQDPDYYGKKVLEKLANDVSILDKTRLAGKMEEIKELHKVFNEIDMEGWTEDGKSEKVLNAYYKEWGDHDFGNYTRLLRTASS